MAVPVFSICICKFDMTLRNESFATKHINKSISLVEHIRHDYERCESVRSVRDVLTSDISFISIRLTKKKGGGRNATQMICTCVVITIALCYAASVLNINVTKGVLCRAVSCRAVRTAARQ